MLANFVNVGNRAGVKLERILGFIPSGSPLTEDIILVTWKPVLSLLIQSLIFIFGLNKECASHNLHLLNAIITLFLLFQEVVFKTFFPINSFVVYVLHFVPKVVYVIGDQFLILSISLFFSL